MAKKVSTSIEDDNVVLKQEVEKLNVVIQSLNAEIENSKTALVDFNSFLEDYNALKEQVNKLTTAYGEKIIESESYLAELNKLKKQKPKKESVKSESNKPFNPDEEALLLFWQVEELLKKSEQLQNTAAQKMNLVPTSLVITTNRLRQCYEGMRLALGK